MLGVEGLYGAGGDDGLAGIGGGFGKRVLCGAGAPAHLAAEGDQRKHDDGNGDEHVGRKTRAGDDHHRHRADAEDCVAQGERGRRADAGLDLRGVGGEPRDDLAGPVDVKEGRRQPGDVLEDVASQIGDDALSDQDDEVVAQRAGNARGRAAMTSSMAK